MPAGSSARLAAASAAPNRAGRWRSYQGMWSRPTAWWWVIVPPPSITASDARVLDLPPLPEQGAVATCGMEREIGRRAVGVDVGEPAGDQAGLAGGFEDRLSVAEVTASWNASKRSQVIAVSKVSTIRSRGTRTSR